MSQCSLTGTGCLVFAVSTTFIRENHSISPAFLTARAQEHVLAGCPDRWWEDYAFRNRGWQTVLPRLIRTDTRG